MGKSSRRENRRNRKKDRQVPLSGLKVAVATTPGSSSSLSVVKELELVKAAILYADQVSLLSPVAALTLGVHQLTTSDDEELLDFMFSLDDRTLSRIGVSRQHSEALTPLRKLTSQYGSAHDQPIDPATLASRLAAIGVKPERTRSTALGQLAQQLPPPILARLTGLAPTTTVRWNAAVAASYARNFPTPLRSTE